LQEAKEQATYEFGSSLLGWRELPLGIEDPIGYGAQLFAEQRESDRKNRELEGFPAPPVSIMEGRIYRLLIRPSGD